MGVQVQITFTSLDEAIVALGKLALPVKAVTIAPASLDLKLPAVEKTPRQPRSDAGKTRGPHKKDEPNAGAAAKETAPRAPDGDSRATSTISTAAKTGTTDPSSTAASPAGASTSTTPAPVPATAPAPVKPAVPTLDDVQKAVEKLYSAVDFDDTEKTLRRFGVSRGKDLFPEHRADFIRRVDDIAAKKYAATDSWPELA